MPRSFNDLLTSIILLQSRCPLFAPASVPTHPALRGDLPDRAYRKLTWGNRPYHSFQSVPPPSSVEDAILNLRGHLLDAVRLRLRADVPLGIYLSGGIDSSALAGMAAHLVRTEGLSMGDRTPEEGVCCFSIGFGEETGYDESSIARRTAQHLNVNFDLSRMDEDSLSANFAQATYHIEHQNHDLNYIGKYILSSVPRAKGFKVVLTGEGADEQFGGYPLFVPDFLRGEDGTTANQIYEAESRVKESYELIGARTDTFFSPKRSIFGGLSTPSAITSFNIPLKVFHPSIRNSSSFATHDPLDALASDHSPAILKSIKQSWHPLNSSHYIWSKSHLANQFLSCLGDRVEMAHSLEARTPFLDHVVTEYVNTLPSNWKIRWKASEGGGQDEGRFIEKWILREAVRPFVTDEVYNRTKHPYSAPVNYPKGGPIHNMLMRWLTKDNVERRLGFVDWVEVQRLIGQAWGEEADDIGQSGGARGMKGDCINRAVAIAIQPTANDLKADGHCDRQSKSKSWAWRQLVVIAQWIVLGERFNVKPYVPESIDFA